MYKFGAMTETNFAISSVLAAPKIVFTVSTTCFRAEVRLFCQALAVQAFEENIIAKVTANAIGSCDDIGKASL